MIYLEKKKNLFTVEDKYFFAHCISEDCALGKGIAVEFQNRYNLRERLKEYKDGLEYPQCIRIGKVFNLVTKKNYWDKPTFESLELAVILMREIALVNDIKFIAMPKIGCGLDKLYWPDVRTMIQKVFKDTDIEILVCYL